MHEMTTMQTHSIDMDLVKKEEYSESGRGVERGNMGLPKKWTESQIFKLCHIKGLKEGAE